MGTTNNFSPQTPRKLYVGPFQPTLETALAAEITACKKQHGPLAPLTVIVPTRLLGLHLQRSLPFPHANVRFQILDDLLPPAALANPFALELLCRQLAHACDGYFAPVRDMPGFAAALLATFTDLQEAGLATLTGNSPKLRDLAGAYKAYRAWLTEHNLTTNADLFLHSALRTPHSAIFLYGFYDLNHAQQVFVERLAPAAVFFPHTEHSAYAQPLLDWFQTLGYEIQSPTLPRSHTPTLHVLSCPGETAEVREAVRALFDYLCAHPAKTFADCAILCRSREQYDAILRDTLQQLGIRAFFRGGRPLAEHNDAKLLGLLLDVIRSDFSRASVMELACHIGPNSRWDALSVRLGIVGGKEQWRGRVQAAGAAAQDVWPFLDNLFNAVGVMPVQASWSDYAERLVSAFTKLGGRHEQVIAGVRGLGGLDVVQSPVAFETVAEFCQKALDAERAQPETFQGGGLFVGDVMGARGLSFDFVVVLGLVEKSFPRFIREDPLLLDAERQRISAALPLKSRGYDEERLLFDLVCGVARDRLVLSFPRLDAGTARPRGASALLREHKASVREVLLSEFNAENPVDERELDLAALQSGGGDQYLNEISPRLADGVAAERSRWRTHALTRHDGIIEAAAALGVLRDRFGLDKLVISATSLEDFFGCPFYYFQKHVLRVEKWEEPEAAIVIEPLALGSLYHDILEDYFRQPGDLDAIMTKHFQRVEREGVTGYPAVWEIKKEIVRQELTAFIARDQRRRADWKPSKFEEEFNGLAVAPPVRLRGKIDRIDVSADDRRARVLDYKTGKLPAGLKNDSLAAGEALQLPLYLLAARQLLPGKTVDAASYLYFTLRGGYREVSFTGAALDARQADLNRLLETAAEMIRAGVFVQHATEKGCRHCDFRPICGNAIVKLAERKTGDARLESFHESKEAAQ